MQSYIYNRGHLMVLDQLKVPHAKDFIEIKTAEDAWEVIRNMNVRGAPLIAVVASLGISVDALSKKAELGDAAAAAAFLRARTARLRTSRPTAVNLFRAMDELEALVDRAAAELPSGAAVVDAFTAGAERVMEEDVAHNRAIGAHGLALIRAQDPGKDNLRILTICNTGSLATGGFGTALGVVRACHEHKLLEQVYACETRPYNQGGRLTAYEIVEDGLPGTLIVDSAAALLMKTRQIDCVVVGADRVAANGDTANKIGTYQLAVAARHHGVPFYVAAPTTTLDPKIICGDDIPIEERSPTEITHQKVPIAPATIPAWNPAFDVTPAELITAIITERGPLLPARTTDKAGNVFDVPTFLENADGAPEQKQASTYIPPLGGWSPGVVTKYGYYEMTVDTVAHYLVGVRRCREVLGTADASAVTSVEFGDGNLNLVFRCEGPQGGVLIAKQALPYVRCVGEGPPSAPIRQALIAGRRLPGLAGHLGAFLARTLFFTSSLHLSGPEKRAAVAKWSENHPLCALTEQVIFTEPYIDHTNNRWTTPQVCTPPPEETPPAMYKKRCEGSTFAIDPEFAFYGPMGFDVGAILGNLLLAHCAAPGHRASQPGDHAAWVLDEAGAVWDRFAAAFLGLWGEEK
ncbi:unnamed protein product [Heterosigma akashiwo]